MRVDTVEKRKDLPGLDPRRADIILGGAVILEQVMHTYDATSLVVSENATDVAGTLSRG